MKKIGVILIVLGLLSGGLSGYLFYRANKAERIGRSMTRSNYGSRLGRRILLRIAKKRRTRGSFAGGAALLLLIGGGVMMARGGRQSVQVKAPGSDR